jgi:hypothetical protein
VLSYAVHFDPVPAQIIDFLAPRVRTSRMTSKCGFTILCQGKRSRRSFFEASPINRGSYDRGFPSVTPDCWNDRAGELRGVRLSSDPVPIAAAEQLRNPTHCVEFDFGRGRWRPVHPQPRDLRGSGLKPVRSIPNNLGRPVGQARQIDQTLHLFYEGLSTQVQQCE